MRRRRIRSFRRLSIAVVTVLLGAPLAQAQTTGQLDHKSAEKRNTGADTTTLPAIIVTANKRSQNLQDVPMSMSAISGFELQKVNAIGFSDYLARVPGVNLVSLNPGLTQIVIRGITTGSRQANSAVSTYIDDVPFGSSTVYAEGSLLTPDIDPSDLEQIEVLRGPQGTLYGSSSLGGLIKFVTRPPDSTAFYGRVQADASSLTDGGNGFTGRAMLNIPLVTKKLALRVSGFKRYQPGYVDDIGRGLRNSNRARVDGGRAQLMWTPNQDVSLRLSALSQNIQSPGLGNEGGGVDIDPATLRPIYGPFENKHTPGTGAFKEGYRMYAATLSDNFGWAKLVATTSYADLNLRENTDLTVAYGPILGPVLGIQNLGVAQVNPLKQRKSTQEIRLQSPSNQKLEWRLGVFYTHEHSTNQQSEQVIDSMTGAPISLPFSLGDVIEGPALFTEKAIYGDVTYHFTNRFDVLIGARYSHDSTQYTQVGSGLLLGDSNFTTSSVDNPKTFLINPSFKLADNTLLYARIATGFRPGGANIGVPPGLGAPVSFGPDRIVGYTLGLKNTLLDDRMTFDIDGFYMNWSSIQITEVNGGFAFLSNGGKAKSQGVEAAWTYRPVGGLTVTASTSWTEANLTKNTPSGVFGIKGARLPYVPRWNADLGATYNFPIAAGWVGYVGGNYNFVGARQTDFQSVPEPRLTLPGYRVLDLHAGINHDDWSFGIYVKNAANSKGIGLVAPETTNPIGAPFVASYILPRLVGVTASYDF